MVAPKPGEEKPLQLSEEVWKRLEGLPGGNP